MAVNGGSGLDGARAAKEGSVSATRARRKWCNRLRQTARQVLV